VQVGFVLFQVKKSQKNWGLNLGTLAFSATLVTNNTNGISLIVFEVNVLESTHFARNRQISVELVIIQGQCEKRFAVNEREIPGLCL
jgi:hypothetical protein